MEWERIVEGIRIIGIASDCIDTLRDELERATGQQAELILEIIRRLERGIGIIRPELVYSFLARTSILPSRFLH
jgi:hypothetical protein